MYIHNIHGATGALLCCRVLQCPSTAVPIITFLRPTLPDWRYDDTVAAKHGVGIAFIITQIARELLPAQLPPSLLPAGMTPASAREVTPGSPRPQALL